MVELTSVDPSNDPEVAQSGIEFMTRLVGQFPQILLNHQPPNSLEYILMFTLKALAGTDPLPKASATDFWVRSQHPCL